MSRRIAYLVMPALALLAILSFTGPDATVADDAKPAESKADAPRGDDKSADKDAKSDKGDRSDRGDRNDDDNRRWSGRPGYGDHRSDGRSSSRWEPFSAEELNEIIAAVAPKNPKLAEKMKERFADTLRRPQGPQLPKLSPEQIEKAMVVFEDRSPEFAQRLRESLKDNPDRLNAILAMQWERLKKMIELKETDPEMYKAQTEEIRKEDVTRGLIWRLRKLVHEKKPENQTEIDSLKEQLRSAIVAKEKAENEVRKLEIERLQQQIVKINEKIAEENINIEEGAKKSLDRIMEWINSPGPSRRGDGRDSGRDGNREGGRGDQVKSEEKK